MDNFKKYTDKSDKTVSEKFQNSRDKHTFYNTEKINFINESNSDEDSNLSNEHEINKYDHTGEPKYIGLTKLTSGDSIGFQSLIKKEPIAANL